MDFGRNLQELQRFLDDQNISWALIGGVALAVYGIARTTLDLDLAVDAEAQDQLVGFMESQGYETLHRTAGYSNHLHLDAARGRIDFVYVRDATRDQLFAEAQTLPGPRGLTVPVAKPEHLIAMKLSAIQDDPDRTFQDLADIRNLARLPGVDHETIRHHFERYGLHDRYRELEGSL